MMLHEGRRDEAVPHFAPGTGPHILLLEARFYADIADEIMAAAIHEIEKVGGSYERISVPGCLEIPCALSLALESNTLRPFEGCVALGCVIRGKTSHYEIVCEQSAAGLQSLALAHLLPVGNGILTVENMDQARERAAVTGENRGGMAARACLGMIDLKRRLLSGATGV